MSILARRYAKALLELGVESNNLDLFVNEISAVAASIDASHELRNVLENPQISQAERKSVLVEIAQRLGVGLLTKNTLGVLAEKGRLLILPSIANELRKAADVRKGIVRAHVTSAVPLQEAYVQKLTQTLETRYGKKVLLQRSVDPSLIAGIVTRIGDTIIDGSLRSRLSSLKSTLLTD